MIGMLPVTLSGGGESMGLTSLVIRAEAPKCSEPPDIGLIFADIYE